MPLLPELYLRERYEVQAQFYRVHVSGRNQLMRREARINRIGAGGSEPDAVVTMLNPGSSLPTKGKFMNYEWQEATPDNTQFQLMRLMERLDWKSVSIINLSDLCTSNVTSLSALVSEFNKKNIEHSRFQNPFDTGLTDLAAKADYVLYAWGSSKIAKRLATEFRLIGDLENRLELGKVPKAAWHETSGYPKHPYPHIQSKCEAWLDEMEAAIKQEAFERRCLLGTM